MFRRRKDRPEEGPEDAEAFEDDFDASDELDAGDDDEVGEEAGVASATGQGPWDVADAPDDGMVRLDLGSMRVPGAAGMEIQVNMDETGGNVIGVTAVHGQSTLQLQAFAAPRSEGIWEEVRRELAAQITKDGGLADVQDSRFGPSLKAQLPFPQPNGTTALTAVRFIGCDGPRWFLRGVLTGAAAADASLSDPLLEVFTGTVVVRGGEAYAPREPLPLRLPHDLTEAVEGTEGGRRPMDRDPLDIGGTGQQIAEIR